MSPPALRVGEPASASGPPLPIEGARLFFGGPCPRFLIGYHQPTAPEVSAVESGDVEVGVYHRDGVAAVVVRAGERPGHWLVEACAPLRPSDVYAQAVGGDGAPARPAAPYVAELALCDTADDARGVVRAVRRLVVPAPVVAAAHRTALAQTPLLTSRAATARALRALTVRHLMDHAVTRAYVPDGRAAV